jgi:hypothetical protein
MVAGSLAMAIQLPLPRRLNVYRSSALSLILANTSTRRAPSTRRPSKRREDR